MRDGKGQVEKERFVLVLLDKVQPGFDEKVVRVVRRVDLNALGRAVADGEKVVGVVRVRVDVFEIAEKGVETLAVGCARIVLEAQAPLAEKARRVTCRLHPLRQRGVLVPERGATVAAHVGVAHVGARHQRPAGRGADRRTGVELRKPRPLLRHLVQARRLDFALPVRAKVAVAHVVGEDDDEVGRTSTGLRRRFGEREAAT